MKFLKILSAIIVLSFVMASCNKESITEVEENKPEVVVVEETGETSSVGDLVLGLATFTLNDVAIYTFHKPSGEVNNYQIGLNADVVGVAGQCGGFVFNPEDETETTLQEGTYDGATTLSSANWISQAGLDAFAAWEAAGSDPNTEPNIFDYILQYDAAGMSYTFTNLTATTVDVEISGEIVDAAGTVTSVSGSFNATIQ